MSQFLSQVGPVLSRRGLLAAATITAAATLTTPSAAEEATDISKLPRVKQALVLPPFLPVHDQIAKGGPQDC